MSVEALHFELSDIEERYQKAVVALGSSKKMSMDIAPGFADVPVLEIVRGIREGISLSLETLDRLARFCIVQKTVTIRADGEILGIPFCMSTVDDDWIMFDVFKQYPVALQFLLNVCEDHILKKSMPPLRSIPEKAAGTTEEGVTL